jgi:hypothetical protein
LFPARLRHGALQIAAEALLPRIPKSDEIIGQSLSDVNAFRFEVAYPMDSIFKPLFSMTGAIALDRESCQFALSLMKIPMLLRLTWAL